jgi:excisionase family DNA binding protein
MRYRVRVSRVQSAERQARAVDEEDAIRKIQEELDRPYGYLGSWQTTATYIEVLEVDPAIRTALPPVGEGPMILPLKDAAKHLGVAYGAMYELVNAGEIEHLRLGRRMFISRDALKAFVASNSHAGRNP